MSLRTHNRHGLLTVHIPPELVPSILQHISPTPPSPLPGPAFIDRSWQQYRHDLRAFIQCALVCRTWCTFTREIMLHTLIVPWLDESILQLCSILRQFGSYSRVMIIFTIDAGDSVRLNRNDFCVALDGCFSSMPQMPKVEIYGAMDRIFGYSLPAEVGRFDLLSLRSLKLAGSVGHSGKSLLDALGRVAPFLETLEIMYFETWPFDHSLPTSLGKLHSLILHCTYLSVPGVIDLLRGPDEDGNSGQVLQKLVIIPGRLQSIPPPDITPLLTFDSTGERLRFLMIHALDPCRSLECCPALETFVYVSPTSSNIFPFLPRTLRRLAISVMLLSPSNRFVAYISSENARNLLHLAVALKHDADLAFTTTSELFISVTEACKDAGVSLTWMVPGMLGLGLEGWDDVTELFQTVQSLPRARLKLI
ncbi:uncharacterized protein BJ212DRAFT_1476228 [Suillus subaureus]|uniref:F-box domain-containing protein n=1 Tax=Suillus subaureus TaxID=48587 RepID=A0A9P7ELS3_9AGAM|nr:uncharacterized protein BJ212DRAFT_1476228 [Suillus subaureus]KAG1824944.1 hypothetical protein BJ212DRAFT_1476228 [Suillus subaureus]